MNADRVRDFRRQAMEKELVYIGFPDVARAQYAYYFDLSAGELYGYPEASKVRELVELARACAVDYDYGEHVSLLNLVADRKELERFQSNSLGSNLNWNPPYAVSPDQSRWISLADWLSEQGQSPDLGPFD